MTLLARVAAVLREASVSHALIGAGALTVHGVNRATHDLDLLVVDPSCLRVEFWSALESQEVSAEVRKGDLTDPLAGVIRLRLPGEVPVDVVVGKFTWQRTILDRAVVRNTQEAAHLPVVRAADLILLKLYAGGAQDGWDIQQLLEGGARAELMAEVEQLLPALSPRAVKLWRKVLED